MIISFQLFSSLISSTNLAFRESLKLTFSLLGVDLKKVTNTINEEINNTHIATSILIQVSLNTIL